MSYDVYVFGLPPGIRSTDELMAYPEHERVRPLGTRELVLRTLTGLFPEAEFSNPSWGRLQTEFGSMEISIGQDDPVQCIALGLRATPAIMPVVKRLGTVPGWTVIDQTGVILRPDDPSIGGMAAWLGYRDQVLGMAGSCPATDGTPAGQQEPDRGA